MKNLKDRALTFYERNEARVDIGFFVGGFVLDVFTLSDIDDPLSIIQQLVYLFLTGAIIFFKLQPGFGDIPKPGWLRRIWDFHDAILHFLLGSLLSIYSLFFLKSSSFSTSLVFILLLLGLMIANEMSAVQKRADIKVGLFFICVFSFFSMLFPVLLGFVGLVPFSLAFLCTAGCVYLSYRLILARSLDPAAAKAGLLVPGGSVAALFLVFYLIGWIPPVPLSVQSMGIYHSVEKVDGGYVASHENPWWRFWHSSDQDFRAEPGDRIFFFAQIFSPARFDDSVVLHWYYKDPKLGWKSTDRIPMRVLGGRKQGYRGFSVKQNYVSGDWRISVETTDGREIGRLYFEVTKVEQARAGRTFTQVTF